jgi:ADP-heptose:LPS heptosyltransferase
MRILFITSTRIGDAVITCGVLDHLIRTHPQARITVVCGRVAGGLFVRMPNLDRLILLDKQRFDLHWLALWRQVVTTAWDLVVDLRGSATAYLLAARRRVVSRRLPGRKFEQLGALLGIAPPPLPVVWTAPEDRARAAALLPEGTAIALGPTANWPPKIWPADRFAALFRRLREARLPGAVPVVLGGPGPGERALAAPLLAALPEAIDLCGRLTLAEAAACIQRCALYIGNDSGLMHLAAATGTATLGLCGTTRNRAAEMAPAGHRAAWALAGGPDMRDLTVDQAFAGCLTLLDTPPSPAPVTGLH